MSTNRCTRVSTKLKYASKKNKKYWDFGDNDSISVDVRCGNNISRNSYSVYYCKSCIKEYFNCTTCGASLELFFCDCSKQKWFLNLH
jgi:hypothetical protein